MKSVILALAFGLAVQAHAVDDSASQVGASRNGNKVKCETVCLIIGGGDFNAKFIVGRSDVPTYGESAQIAFGKAVRECKRAEFLLKRDSNVAIGFLSAPNPIVAVRVDGQSELIRFVDATIENSCK